METGEMKKRVSIRDAKYGGCEVVTEKVKTELICDGLKYHRHPNGGGLVADTAIVDEEAYIGPFVRILGNVCVEFGVKITGLAQVQDNAKICCHSEISGTTVVSENARVCNSKIYENARIYGNAYVTCAQIGGNTKIHGKTQVTGDGEYNNRFSKMDWGSLVISGDEDISCEKIKKSYGGKEIRS